MANQKQSWFYKWIINNKFISVLSGVLLLLLIIFMLDKVHFIFKPLSELFSAVGAPVILAGVFYYLLNPLVDRFQFKYHVKRWITITVEFVILIGLVVWGLAVAIPALSEQVNQFVKHWPEYWSNLNTIADEVLHDPRVAPIQDWLIQQNDNIAQSLQKLTSGYASGAVGSVTGLVGHISGFFITLVTFPFILFYLLKDGHDMPFYMARFFPKATQKSFIHVLGEINQQVSNYIRGQLIVAFSVAVMFSIGYAVVGLPFGWVIGIAAGFLNLIPFLGSFLAMIPAIVVALFISPWMLVKVLIVFMIEQTLEGKVISPKVLGDSLKIHPVTVIVVLLSAGNIFGVMGVIFGIPGYAVAKVLVSHFYSWWQSNSEFFSPEERDQIRSERQQKMEASEIEIDDLKDPKAVEK